MQLNSLFNIQGKKVVIVGSTGWIGSEITREFKEFGADVTEINRETVDGSFNYSNYITDLHIISDLDVLINIAWDMNFKRTSWQKQFNCLNWYVDSCEILLPRMRRYGSVINISSMYSLVSPDDKMYRDTDYCNHPAYGAMKAALNQYTKRLAVQWGEKDIRVNAILPGPIPKPDVSDRFTKKLVNRTCLNYLGMPRDLVGPVLWLATQASDFVTGQCIQVDGGWTVR